MRVILALVWAIAIPVAAFAQSTPRLEGRMPCPLDVRVLKTETFSLSVGRVRLVDGRACVKPFAEYPGCEWSVELVRAERWGTEGRYLVVALDTIHDTPGARLSVLVYECREGRYESVFGEEFGLRGATLVLGNDETFDVVTGDWLPADAGCYPSRERRTTYRWDDRRKQFVQAASELTPRR